MRISDWSSDVCSSDLPAWTGGEDRDRKGASAAPDRQGRCRRQFTRIGRKDGSALFLRGVVGPHLLARLPGRGVHDFGLLGLTVIDAKDHALLAQIGIASCRE